MPTLAELCNYMDNLLQSKSIQDYPNALNGLQLENQGTVSRIAAAVDASESTIDQAIRAGADLLLVHHGLFWSGLRPVTGVVYRKLKKAMDAGLAIYSSHLPLDVYGEFGNSFLLAQAIGMEDLTPFHEYKGAHVGVSGEWKGTRQALIEALEKVLGGSVHISPFGPEEDLGRVAIVSGGAGADLELVYSQRVTTFISGEGAHWTVPIAEELGMNLVYAGHYATETFGVQRLAEHLAGKYGLSWSFISNPTGL